MTTTNDLLLLDRASIDDFILLQLLRGQSGFWLPLREQTGTIADNANYTAGPGAELLTNGSLAAWSADNPTGWTISNETAPDPEITERDPGQGHGDTKTTGGAANIYSSASGTNPRMYQQPHTVGDTYRLRFDITNLVSGSIRLTDAATGFVTIANAVGSYEVTDIATAVYYQMQGWAQPIDVTVDNLSSVLVGQLDGKYSGPTLAGDTFCGYPAPTFDGVNDQCYLEYNRMESIFKPENAGFEWSFGIAYKMSQTDYQDSNFHPFIVIGVDLNNRVILYKDNTSDKIAMQVAIGSAVLGLSDTTAVASRYGKWNRIIGTINKAQNRFRLYINGVQIGSDSTYPVGTWSASALTQAFSSVGSNNSSIWGKGSFAMPFGVSREMTAGEVAQLDALIKSQEPNAA